MEIDSILDLIANKSLGVYFPLSEIAKYVNSDNPWLVIQKWICEKNTLEFLGYWEKIHNPGFCSSNCDLIIKEAGSNDFLITPQKWIKKTKAIGIRTNQSHFPSDTYACKEIAVQFATWVSPLFMLYYIQLFQSPTEYQTIFSGQPQITDQSLKKLLHYSNHIVRNDSIKKVIIPPNIKEKECDFNYEDETDLINTALFGKTKKQWMELTSDENADIIENATIEQLLVLMFLRNADSLLIENGLDIRMRAIILNELARIQMKRITGIDCYEPQENDKSKARDSVERKKKKTIYDICQFEIGDRITHLTYGKGKITEMHLHYKQDRFLVVAEFETVGEKMFFLPNDEKLITKSNI